MSSNRPYYQRAIVSRPTQSFNPDRPREPSSYVDQLIKIVRGMAPHANRFQWNRFAVTARNIELSHDFFLAAATDEETTNKDVVVKKKEKQLPFEQMGTEELTALFFKYEREAEDLATQRDEIEAKRVKKNKDTVTMYHILAKRKQEGKTRRNNVKD